MNRYPCKKCILFSICRTKILDRMKLLKQNEHYNDSEYSLSLYLLYCSLLDNYLRNKDYRHAESNFCDSVRLEIYQFFIEDKS